MIVLKEIPHNLTAEQIVLADMLLEKEAAIKAMNELKVEDFYREAHKLIFTAMLELLQKQEPLNLLALEEQLAQKKELDKVGGLAYLMGLNSSSPTTANLGQCITLIKKEAVKRQLLKYAQEVTAGVASGQEVDLQLDNAVNRLNSMLSKRKLEGFSELTDMLDDYINEISGKDVNYGKLSGLSTGYQGLDEITNGLQASDFIILAARPSMGKTAMALNLIENMLMTGSQENITVCMFSMEMSKKQLMNRLTSLLTGLDSMRLDCNRLDEEEWELIWKANDLLRDKKLFVDDAGGLNMAALASKARKLYMEKGLDIIFIDYVQLMAGITKSQDRQQAIAEISRSLKALARELQIPIVAISQLSRAVEGRLNKRPLMSDLRESGSLEQDADIIMFLYRDDYYFSNSEEPGVTELIVAKHRNGPIGTFKFYFEKQHTRFVELL